MLWRIKAILFGEPESKFSRKWAFSIISSLFSFFFFFLGSKWEAPSYRSELSFFLLGKCVSCIWSVCTSEHTHTHTISCKHRHSRPAGFWFRRNVNPPVLEQTVFFFFRRMYLLSLKQPLPPPPSSRFHCKFLADCRAKLDALCKRERKRGEKDDDKLKL